MTLRDTDIREEGVGAAVISGMNAAPVFEPSEHVFDPVTLLIEGCVMGDRDFPIGFGRNADGDFAFGQSIAEPVGM